MNGFMLYGNNGGHTQVPNIFLDKYMPSANGEYVKIYLYLLRCLSSDTKNLSVSSIADRFDRTESDVVRALKYWEKMRLLKLEYDDSRNLSGIELLGDGSLHEESGGTPAVDEKALRQLFFVCEQYFGRPLSEPEHEKLSALHDSLGLSYDLIEYLVEYCVQGGHRSVRYIETVADAWHRDGVSTVEEAKAKNVRYGREHYRILKAFGITDRGPATSELTYMDKWLKEENYSPELILEACGRTVRSISKPSFPYADKILLSWKAAGIRDLDALAKYDSARKVTASGAAGAGMSGANAGGAQSTVGGRTDTGGRGTHTQASDRFHNFNERDYDYGQLEKALVNK